MNAAEKTLTRQLSKVKRNRKFVDLTGQHFAHFVVAEYAGMDKKSRLFWVCRCVCGTFKIIANSQLTHGISKSCGCKRKKHGGCNTREYHVWAAMKSRCLNPDHRWFVRYGGRGIKVCERWMDSFTNFIADMGHRPTPKHSLERIKNDGNYCPSNCKWATYLEQQNNRVDCVFLTLKGEKLTIAQWARRLKCHYDTLYRRYMVGWSHEEILTTPVEIKFRHRIKVQ